MVVVKQEINSDNIKKNSFEAKSDKRVIKSIKLMLPEINKNMQEKFKYKTVMQIPKIEKVVINAGLKKLEGKNIEVVSNELQLITSQKPLITVAKKSISSFGLRKGEKIGCKVTLRRNKMYCFLDKLINIAIPRIRDFRGVDYKSFDGCGNFALGIKDQLIFPEINYDSVKFKQGMDIIIVTTAKTNKEGLELLRQIKMPFKKS